MKLEFKHIAPYLPNLEVEYKGNRIKVRDFLNNAKPVLRRLQTITEGEVKALMWHSYKVDVDDIDIGISRTDRFYGDTVKISCKGKYIKNFKFSITFYYEFGVYSPNIVPMSFYQWLCDNGFDIDWLIYEQLAVEK